jgi:protein-histidine pros-kinase
MGLRLKFNMVLVVVFGAGIAVSGWVSHELLQRNAKDEVLRNAGLMMERRSPSAATPSRR